MNPNQEIKENLIRRFNIALNSFESKKETEPILDSLYNALAQFDFDTYNEKLKAEVTKNISEWWTNTERGIIPEEELFAVLFEYDHFLQQGVEALAYGIGQWKDYQVETDKFKMGFNHDFTTEFYACPGITVNFFDPLEALDGENLDEQYSDIVLEDLYGYEQLIEIYKTRGMLAIHETLAELNEQGAFDALNCKPNFMFLIDEHDSGEVYPLLIKNYEAQKPKTKTLPDTIKLAADTHPPKQQQAKKWWQFWK